MSPKDQQTIDCLGREVVQYGLAWRTCERKGQGRAAEALLSELRTVIDALQREVDRHVPPDRLTKGGAG